MVDSAVKQPRVEYSHNNSGGQDWLTTEDWDNLAKAGWEIEENQYSGKPYSATRYGILLDEAISEWTIITGEYAGAQGCPCCGNPHTFSWYSAEDKYLGGNEVDYYDDDDDGY